MNSFSSSDDWSNYAFRSGVQHFAGFVPTPEQAARNVRRRNRSRAGGLHVIYSGGVMGDPVAAEQFDADPLAGGVVIAGRYELGSQLGVGGMGVVWRGRDRRLARAVAVKVLSKSSVGSEIARTRLIREARAAAALEHEGIIRVYDVGETDDGGAFLVMELIRGRSLRGVLESGAMKPGTRAGVIVQAARALQFAHEAGIVHRDVKPDNIMIREDGRVTVVDFGVAKPLSTELMAIAGTVAGTPPAATLTGPGQLVGTPAYLAPEQARGHDVTAATDQFALAVTAFEALSGKRPWGGTGFSEAIASLLRDAPTVISTVVPLLPRALDDVFNCALAKSPSDRFSDIGAFADALEEASASLELDPPISLRSNSRRLGPSSSREPGGVTPPEAERTSSPPIDAEARTETAPGMLLSAVEQKIVVPPAPVSAPVVAMPATPVAATPVPAPPVAATPVMMPATTAPSSAVSAPGRSRLILAVVLGVVIVGGVGWSIGRTPPSVAPPVASTTPTAPVPAASPSAESVTTTEAPASTGVPTLVPPKVRPPRAPSLTASARVAPLAPSAAPSPPLTAVEATASAPAPKSTGRRVRTDL